MEISKEDIIKMIILMKSEYGAYSNLTQEEMQIVINMWFENLHKYPAEIVAKAFNSVLRTCKFKPTIAHFIEQIEKMEDALGKSDYELWDELFDAIGRVGWLKGAFSNTYIPAGETKTQGQLAREEVEEIFNKLDPIIKAYVVNTKGLLNLVKVDLDIEKGRFLKAIPSLKGRKNQQRQLEMLDKDIIHDRKYSEEEFKGLLCDIEEIEI